MYKIIFEDDSNFEGNSFEGSWNKIPDKKIKKIEYKIGNKTLIFEGFEQYNHVVKLGFGINNNKIAGVLAIYLLGKNRNKVHRRILNFVENKLEKNIVKWGKEYNNKPHVGWKKGLISETPSIKEV